MECGHAWRGRSDRLDKSAVDAAVQTKALLELGRDGGRGAEGDVHVGGAGEFGVRHAGKVAFADVFDPGDLAVQGRDVLLEALDDLFDGVFLAPVVEDEGRAVVRLFCSFLLCG
jgi:hypothetical protein